MKKAIPFLLLIGLMVSGPSWATSSCGERVALAAEAALGYPEVYQAESVSLITDAYDVSDGTQLWEVGFNLGADGGGRVSVFVVTRGEGRSGCTLLGVFAPGNSAGAGSR